MIVIRCENEAQNQDHLTKDDQTLLKYTGLINFQDEYVLKDIPVSRVYYRNGQTQFRFDITSWTTLTSSKMTLFDENGVKVVESDIVLTIQAATKFALEFIL